MLTDSVTGTALVIIPEPEVFSPLTAGASAWGRILGASSPFELGGDDELPEGVGVSAFSWGIAIGFLPSRLIKKSPATMSKSYLRLPGPTSLGWFIIVCAFDVAPFALDATIEGGLIACYSMTVC